MSAKYPLVVDPTVLEDNSKDTLSCQKRQYKGQIKNRTHSSYKTGNNGQILDFEIGNIWQYLALFGNIWQYLYITGWLLYLCTVGTWVIMLVCRGL